MVEILILSYMHFKQIFIPTNLVWFSAVNYYWARDTFPNFVEEDKRVFVSFDGALYFSALEHIDSGNYSCNVQSKVSDTGRNGPFFPLRVNPHCKYKYNLQLLPHNSLWSLNLKHQLLDIS